MAAPTLRLPGTTEPIIMSGRVGDIIIRITDTPPPHTLELNGAIISRSTYSKLFAAIGTKYGAGDGNTTFALPDLRGEFLRGWDHGRGLDAGRALGSVQSDEIKAHNHTLGAVDVTYTGLNISKAAGSSIGSAWGTTDGFGGAETRPRNVAVMFCIVYE